MEPTIVTRESLTGVSNRHTVDPRVVCWLDVETTGLAASDPSVLLLEVALVVTDLDLRELGRASHVVAYTPGELEAATWDPIARAMHEANGLLLEVTSSSATPLATAERSLLELLARVAGVDLARAPDRAGHAAQDPSAPLWAGCSSSLDREILRRSMPRVYERIHFRTIDATTLKFALEHWTDEATTRMMRPHRALEDALAAINLADQMRRFLLSSRARSGSASRGFTASFVA